MSENFQQVGKVNNKLNHWYYKCKTAECIEGCDNNYI